jgi:hypothetical protein
VLDQVQVGKVTRSWSAAGTVAESPDQDRLHRLVEAGILRSSKEPLSILAADSAAAADIRLPMKVRWDDGRTALTSALNGDPPSRGATVGKNACSTRTSARHGTKPQV